MKVCKLLTSNNVEFTQLMNSHDSKNTPGTLRDLRFMGSIITMFQVFIHLFTNELTSSFEIAQESNSVKYSCARPLITM